MRNWLMFETIFQRKFKVVELDGIGPILLEKRKRARRLTIHIRSSRHVRTVVPHHMSFRRAEDFIHTKTDWIIKQLRRIKKTESEYLHLKNALERMDPRDASRMLMDRLNQLAGEHGFTYNRLFIRKQTTRWGSCSAQNNISLNLKLVCLPGPLMDYVILHELVHTRIKDHSHRFWSELAGYIPDAARARKELREYGRGLL
jgi:predicted metal-dependent hydrolase